MYDSVELVDVRGVGFFNFQSLVPFVVADIVLCVGLGDVTKNMYTNKNYLKIIFYLFNSLSYLNLFSFRIYLFTYID